MKATQYTRYTKQAPQVSLTEVAKPTFSLTRSWSRSQPLGSITWVF